MGENDSMLTMFVLENGQLLEQLEELLLGGEKNEKLGKEQIDETFRVMHTIKGSSAMMGYDAMTTLAHAVEDLFSKIREKEPQDSDWERIFDVVLESIDFFKNEIEKLQQGDLPDEQADELCKELGDILNALIEGEKEGEPVNEEMQAGEAEDGEDAAGEDAKILRDLISRIKQQEQEKIYWIRMFLDKGCQMETVRAYGALMSIEELYSAIATYPEEVEENHDEEIASHGFWIAVSTTEECAEMIKQKISETMFLSTMDFEEYAPEAEQEGQPQEPNGAAEAQGTPAKSKEAPAQDKPSTVKKAAKEEKALKQSFISVNVNKIDKLMNLVGEIVTTESMVTKNTDIADLHLENFEKQARQLRKLTDELQDIVMSIRMVPIATTFHKMQRIVRDISKKTKKQAELVIIGEDTEVDKNIIDNLSDPLMHLIRNAMDHGIETPQERLAAGKSEKGTVTLEACNQSGDVIVRVMDDGAGMDRNKIIQKAIANGLTTKTENEISDKEAYGFTLLPGFSTNDEVTEYSGRGVGMDVVHKNLDNVGGSISVDSEPGKGTTITMHIPLTLAIMDGMKITVGKSIYIVPTLVIREFLEPRLYEIIVEPNGNEMIMIRGVCYPIIRLHRVFDVANGVEDFNSGIMVLVESDSGAACLFADTLLGEQQAVVKPMPPYVVKSFGKIKGINGCSIMGNGGIALILDINNLLE